MPSTLKMVNSVNTFILAERKEDVSEEVRISVVTAKTTKKVVHEICETGSNLDVISITNDCKLKR